MRPSTPAANIRGGKKGLLPIRSRVEFPQAKKPPAWPINEAGITMTSHLNIPKSFIHSLLTGKIVACLQELRETFSEIQ